MVTATGKRWFASSETVVGLMLTKGQQEPECIPARVCCEMQAGNEDASKGSLAVWCRV